MTNDESGSSPIDYETNTSDDDGTCCRDSKNVREGDCCRESPVDSRDHDCQCSRNSSSPDSIPQDGFVDIPKRFGPPPAPDSPEWNDWADRVLEETEFHTALGKEMAQAAFDVSAGKLSQAEFHDRYHEAILEEFGIDERPTKAAFEDESRASSSTIMTGEGEQPQPGIPDSGDAYDRRTMIKGALATAGLLTVGTVAGQTMDSPGGTASAAAPATEDGDVQMGMAIDMERCIACMLCVEECKTENNTSNGANWMHVFRFSEDETDEMDGSMPRPCQHCSDPSCTFVCPTQARFKRDEDGIVLTDYDLCIGCRYCEVGCPYGVNYFEWGAPDDLAGGFPHGRTDRNDRQVAGNPPKGVMGKCTFCVHRQDEPGRRGTTACQEVCPVDAIHFGDMNDPESDPNQHIEAKRSSARFKLLEEQGTGPNIVYIGNQPSMNARPVDGPYSYEDIGVEKRRDGHNVYQAGEES